MMRVGVMTFHAIANFGAVLQAYALCRALRELGCEAQVIDYQPEYLVGIYRHLGRRPNVILNNAIRRWRFARFRRAFIKTTRRIYRTEDDLRANPPDVDVLVCGSDQVWNLKVLQGRLDAGFFLDFLSDRTRRIAYAPSLGDMPFPGEVQGAVAKLLSRFHAVSIREEVHSDLIHSLTGRKPAHVLDPAFLVEDYSPVIKEPKGAPDRYLAVYPIEYCPEFNHFVRRLRDALDMPAVNIGMGPLPDVDYNCVRLGPSEWLGWMRRASFVCTNSFHGTAFSIIFQRDLACFPFHKRPGLTARIEGLLKQFHLHERLIANTAEISDSDVRLNPVDYRFFLPLLRGAISDSRRYLQNSIFAETD